MGRPARYSREELLEVGLALASDAGAGALTMQGLAQASGASNGSVYHRFDSRAELLASVWLSALEAFQRDWWADAEHEEDPGALALLTVRWADNNRAAARLLLLHRVEDFFSDETPQTLREQAQRLKLETQGRWVSLSESFLGSSSPDAIERTVFAFAGLPLAALRQPLEQRRPLSKTAERLLREAATALMSRRTL